MILEVRARYFRDTDSFQVAFWVQEDDGTSASAKVQSGTVEILHGETAIVTEEFDRQHAALWVDGDTSEDRGNFFFFYHHPPLQKNAQARITVTMPGDHVMRSAVGIDAAGSEYAPSWQNPLLQGLPVSEYANDGRMPVRSPDEE